MNFPTRTMGPMVAVTTLVLALGTATPTLFAVPDSRQATPSPNSSSDLARPRELTLEQRADVFMARKNYDDAIETYHQALKQSPGKNPALWNKLGIAYQQESKLHDAHHAYVKAAHADKNFAEAWNNIGTLYFTGKKYQRSLSYFERAAHLKDDVAAFHMNLGSAYYHLKHYPEAVQEYRAALGCDPRIIGSESSVGTVVHAGATDVEYYFYMAKALASTGNAEIAVRYLRRAFEDGYTFRQPIDQDPDFQKISQDPAFVELARNPPAAIKD